MLIGNQEFLEFWENGRADLTEKSAKLLLMEIMELAQMPADLAGTVAETQKLLNQFSLDLQPDHIFWHQFAQVVQTAFPDASLASKTPLARQVHQFRYVISAYQAQWVRQHFPAKTDRQSLLHYLKGKKMRRFWRRRFDFDLSESSRLHNKLPKRAVEGYRLPVNMKIVMGFHTEFILDSSGSFANELDPQGISYNGIINGASFNYADANNQRHYDLDILPVSVNDPAFRQKILANAGNRFRAPKLVGKKDKDWELSYTNKRGYYARNGHSAKQAVVRFKKAFEKELRKKM